MMLFRRCEIILLLLFIVFLTGCLDFSLNWGDDDNSGSFPGYQTAIREVKIEPNPIAVGDSVTFTCIIRDSLDTSFHFLWRPNTQITYEPDIRTETNFLKTTVYHLPGTYTGKVTADNDDPVLRPRTATFSYEVIEKE